MWFSESAETSLAQDISFSNSGVTATLIAVLGTIIFGVDPNLFFQLFKFIIPQ
jgi:hypothetical protein